MTSKPADDVRFSLRRWSQRKVEAARTQGEAPPQPSAAASVQSPAPAAQNALLPPGPAQPTDAPLPPIESLTIESDFAPFFKPQVAESIKRAALKQLFRDPRFNIMDGLDTYIDDYTRPDPIPSAMLEDLMQRRVSLPMLATEPDPRKRALEEPAGAQPATSVEAISPPASDVEPSPVAAAPATAAPAAAEAGPEHGAGAKADSP
jgi:Protein of unknown function (DUF3306)